MILVRPDCAEMTAHQTQRCSGGAGIVNVPVFAVGVAVMVMLNTTIQTRDSAAARSAASAVAGG